MIWFFLVSFSALSFDFAILQINFFYNIFLILIFRRRICGVRARVEISHGRRRNGGYGGGGGGGGGGYYEGGRRRSRCILIIYVTIFFNYSLYVNPCFL